MNGRVFLAGASGAIGRRLCRVLVDEGWTVTGTTRSLAKTPVLRDLGVEPVVVDDAADAARRAMTRGQAGIYNLAEEDGTVSISKAADALGWVPGFRLDEQR